jgi:hypothetical protein
MINVNPAGGGNPFSPRYGGEQWLKSSISTKSPRCSCSMVSGMRSTLGRLLQFPKLTFCPVTLEPMHLPGKAAVPG